LAWPAAPAVGQELPTAPPEAVGFSTPRLERLHTVIQQYVDRQRVSGLVTIIVRNGKVIELDAYGKRDIEANAAMQKDARLLQMMLNGGELDGVRLLGPKTVELMTANHAGTLFNEGKTGFGLGFEIVDDIGKAGIYGSPGEFSWGGAYHTTYWVDPKEKIVAVLMTQLLPATGSDLHERFRNLVYQAVIAPPGTSAAATAAKPRRAAGGTQ
jgi:CubicO group peptidase (beta-lactamase class C family)